MLASTQSITLMRNTVWCPHKVLQSDYIPFVHLSLFPIQKYSLLKLEIFALNFNKKIKIL